MADMRISGGQFNNVPVSTDSSAYNNIADVKVNNTPEINVEDNKETEKRHEKLREEMLENVISVSEDGDTVQVSDEGSDKLNLNKIDDKDKYIVEEDVLPDRKEIKKEALERMELKISLEDKKPDVSIKEDDNKEAPAAKITSFKGYTDAQLKQLYLDGVISRYSYDREVASRDSKREDVQDTNNEFNKDVMGSVSGMERVSQDAEQLIKALASESASTPDPMTRIEIMSTLQNLTQ